MSAPWLVLPFLIGMTQQRARTAAVLGLLVTESALLGYFAMTYSPLEIHPWTFRRFIDGMVAVTTRGWYNPLYILSGLVTGPLFGPGYWAMVDTSAGHGSAPRSLRAPFAWSR